MTTSTPDTIVLTVPTSGRFREVVSLVLGGVGSRFDLSYERMDDIQLAVLSMLDSAATGEVTIEIAGADDRLSVCVGPLRDDAGSDEGLARVLRRLADDVETELRDGGCWATIAVERQERAAPVA